MKVSIGKGFRAQIKQDSAQQAYVFEVIEVASSAPNELQFEKTFLLDVVFTICKDDVPLQPVALANNYMKSSLVMSDTFYISAIINGVTTDITTFKDPNATITAVNDTSATAKGYYTLLVSD